MKKIHYDYIKKGKKGNQRSHIKFLNNFFVL